MKTTHEMMFNDFENPWKAFRSLLLNAAVLNILIRPRRPCQRLCGETFHWHRWLDAKFSLNSPNFNYFGRLFVRRSTKISPKANYGRRHFWRNAIKTNAGLWMTFSSMNVLLCASRARHYGFTICKTNIGFMQEVDLNITWWGCGWKHMEVKWLFRLRRKESFSAWKQKRQFCFVSIFLCVRDVTRR